MIDGHISGVDHLSMRVVASRGNDSGELELAATDRATVVVSVNGFGLPAPCQIEVVPGVLGVWEVTNRGNNLDTELLDFARVWARNFAIAKLEVLSHSLVGSKTERLEAMERLYAGVKQTSGRTVKSSGPTCREMPAPIMVETPMGPLVITFVSDTAAELAIQSLDNPHRSQGYISFQRDPDLGWTPSPSEQWDIGRCLARFSGSPVQIVNQIMQPAVIAAARLKGSSAGRTVSRVLAKLEPSAHSSVDALADDIRKLRSLVSQERQDKRTAREEVVTSFLPPAPRTPRTALVH